jgi:hypothetical protein
MPDGASNAQEAPTAAPDQAKPFRDAIEQIRQRTELTAKAVGALGTAGVSAVGISKFADIFPTPPGQWWAVLLLIVSFLVMILIVGAFTYRLWHVSERVLLRSDPEQMSDLAEGDEKTTVTDVYDQVAALNWAPSFRALEARAQRLYRIADRVDDSDKAKKLKERADGLVADIRSTETRAGMLVVRRRASQAIRGPGAILAYCAFAVAILGFGISADRLDSERTQRAKIVKDCADTKKATQVGGVPALPPICNP